MSVWWAYTLPVAALAIHTDSPHLAVMLPRQQLPEAACADDSHTGDLSASKNGVVVSREVGAEQAQREQKQKKQKSSAVVAIFRADSP